MAQTPPTLWRVGDREPSVGHQVTWVSCGHCGAYPGETRKCSQCGAPVDPRNENAKPDPRRAQPK